MDVRIDTTWEFIFVFCGPKASPHNFVEHVSFFCVLRPKTSPLAPFPICFSVSWGVPPQGLPRLRRLWIMGDVGEDRGPRSRGNATVAASLGDVYF